MDKNVLLALDREARGSLSRSNPLSNSSKFLPFAADHQTIYQKDIKGHTGCVNAVTFNDTEDLVSTGGDDRRVFIWRTGEMMLDEDPKPMAIMDAKHRSNIFALEFAIGSNHLFSGGNDGVTMVHDVHTGQIVRRYEQSDRAARFHPFFGGRAIYGISASPIDPNLFMAVSDSKSLTQFDFRAPKHVEHLNMGHKLISVQFNPAAPTLIAVAGSELVSVFDHRKGTKDLYDGKLTFFASSGSTHASWNNRGTGIGLMRNAAPPVYFDLDANVLYKLKDSTHRFKNIHTIKSLDFIDNAIVCGSEDFRLYIWDIVDDGCTENCPEQNGFSVKEVNEARTLDVFYTHPLTRLNYFQGHRSIPNQVKYSSHNRLLVSSGVEKVIKCWTPMEIPESYANPRTRRIGCFRRSQIPPDASPTGEDVETLAHFDQLIQENRELALAIRRRRASNDDSDHSFTGSGGDSNGSGDDMESENSSDSNHEGIEFFLRHNFPDTSDSSLAATSDSDDDHLHNDVSMSDDDEENENDDRAEENNSSSEDQMVEEGGGN